MRLLVGVPVAIFAILVVGLTPLAYVLWLLPSSLWTLVAGKGGDDPRLERLKDPRVTGLVMSVVTGALFTIENVLDGTLELPPMDLPADDDPPLDPGATV